MIDLFLLTILSSSKGGRVIPESVFMAHEVIHEVHRTGTTGLILKLDYENAYDRVS